MTRPTGVRDPTRRSGADTKAAIITVATQEFRDRGYTVATLDDVAARLGITRSAVLHHFGTKSDILHEIITPWITALVDLVGRHSAPPPLSRAQTRRLVGDLFDVMVSHRDVIRLLTHDISVTVTASGTTPGELAGRLVGILAGGDTDPAALMRASAVLGALSNMTLRLGGEVDFTDDVHRKTAVDLALRLTAR